MAKKHEYDEKTAQLVEVLCACGTRYDIIAKMVGMSRATLQKIYRKELDDGGKTMIAKLGVSVIKRAMDGDRALSIFVLKCRGGWREKSEVSVSGQDGTPLSVGLYPVLDLSALSDKELEQYVALEAKCRQQPAGLPAATNDDTVMGGAEETGVGEA